jgi:hypothetical protein
LIASVVPAEAAGAAFVPPWPRTTTVHEVPDTLFTVMISTGSPGIPQIATLKGVGVVTTLETFIEVWEAFIPGLARVVAAVE